MNNLDIFASNVSLFYKGKTKYNTRFGSFMGLISSFMIALLILAFGQDFFKRTNPSIVRETRILDDYPLYEISNNNFSIAVRIEDDYGNLIEETDIFKLVGGYVYQEKVNGTWSFNVKSFKLEKCNSSMFFLENAYNKLGLDNFYCPDLAGVKLGGSWSSDKLGYIFFESFLCAEGLSYYDYTIVNFTSCTNNLKYDDINYAYLNYFPYMSVFLQEAKSTPSNYTNGMQYSMKQQFFELHKTMEKYETYYFKTYETITDYGWILRDKIPESILGLSSMSSTSSVTSQDYSYRKLGTMFFYLDKDVEVYNREYTKIQVLAANVGGIVRFFFLFFDFIVSFYNSADFLFEIAKFNIIENKRLNTGLNKTIHFNNNTVKDIVSINKFKANESQFQDNQLQINKLDISNKVSLINSNKLSTKILKSESFDINTVDKDLEQMLINYKNPMSYFCSKLSCTKSSKENSKRLKKLLLFYAIKLDILSYFNLVISSSIEKTKKL